MRVFKAKKKTLFTHNTVLKFILKLNLIFIVSICLIPKSGSPGSVVAARSVQKIYTTRRPQYSAIVSKFKENSTKGTFLMYQLDKIFYRKPLLKFMCKISGIKFVYQEQKQSCCFDKFKLNIFYYFSSAK